MFVTNTSHSSYCPYTIQWSTFQILACKDKCIEATRHTNREETENSCTSHGAGGSRPDNAQLLHRGVGLVRLRGVMLHVPHKDHEQDTEDEEGNHGSDKDPLEEVHRRTRSRSQDSGEKQALWVGGHTKT